LKAAGIEIMKILLRMLKYIAGYKAAVAVAVFCTMVYAVMNAFSVYLIGPFLKKLFLSSTVTEAVLDPKTLGRLEQVKLFLKVNREKTRAAHVNFTKYLGYSFYVYRGEGRLRIHPKSVAKLKDKIREVTGRSNGMGIEERKSRLNSIVRGWMNYFKLADAKKLLEGLDEWIRRRIRMVTWKRWKRTILSTDRYVQFSRRSSK